MQSNGSFDLSEYAGVVASDDSDAAGKSDRHATHALQVPTPEGTHGAYYSTLIGWPFLKADGTVIKLLAEAEKYDGSSWVMGRYEITIRGKRLQPVFDAICEARRLSVKVSGQVADGKKPEVTAVEVVEFRD